MAEAPASKALAGRYPKLYAEIGFCAVLHIHLKRLDYHPHLHVVIPGGGFDKTEGQSRLWRKLEQRYLFHGFALAKVFRAKLIDALPVPASI